MEERELRLQVRTAFPFLPHPYRLNPNPQYTHHPHHTPTAPTLTLNTLTYLTSLPILASPLSPSPRFSTHSPHSTQSIPLFPKAELHELKGNVRVLCRLRPPKVCRVPHTLLNIGFLRTAVHTAYHVAYRAAHRIPQHTPQHTSPPPPLPTGCGASSRGERDDVLWDHAFAHPEGSSTDGVCADQFQ